MTSDNSLGSRQSGPMLQTGGGKRHYWELDSLRGLAALSVVCSHYLNLFRDPQSSYPNARNLIETIALTPLFGLFAGHEAVMLFFVLSGFVLSLQFIGRKEGGAHSSRLLPSAYLSFAIKRTFRIYVPYAVIIAVAIVANALFAGPPLPQFGSWFSLAWTSPITIRSIADHFIFLHDFTNYQYDPVLWSLVHELRISLIFPFLMLWVLPMRWERCLMLAGVLSVFGIVASLLWIKVSGRDTDYLMTIHYTGVFLLGFLLARHLGAISTWFVSRSVLARGTFVSVGYLVYCYSHLLPGRLVYFSDIPTALGAAVLVVASLCSARVSALLTLESVKTLGRISFSLYLLHCVLLLASVHLLHSLMPLPAILAIALFATFLLSSSSYKHIELPAIEMGRRLVARLVARTASSPVG